VTAARSRDGTEIVFEGSGTGPPVIFVDGAMTYRDLGPSRALSAELSKRFTVFTYDRRGRGESADTEPYSSEREVEDLEAVISAAGGLAALIGASSGAVLALDAAAHGLPVTKLALYEPPVIVDDSREPLPADYREMLIGLLDTGRRADAAKLFMREVGVPGFLIALMPLFPAWGKQTRVAHTLVYDATFMEGLQAGRPLPAERWASVEAPTLVADGGKSPAWLHNGADAVAAALPNASRQTLAGQTHMVKAKALGPMLSEFLAT
jgi:pimeloyl-ACP methyl ester carboxylesterase